MDRVLKNYEIGRTLGTGAFSEVKLATEKSTKKQFAMKIIDKSKCLGKENMIMSEVSILKKVKHPNIISLIEMYETDTSIYLVMELVTGGELFDSIVERGHYSERETSQLVNNILSAVDYLHDMGIAHRDLKPENLMYSDRSPTARIMLGDFGLSKIFNDEEVMKTACGTPGYVAPEVLKRKGYGCAVDLWSIGVITYILLCGYPPFYEENNIELFNVIMRGEYEFDSPYWDKISKEAKDFISKLLVVDSNKRINAKAALQHPFITTHNPQPIAASLQSRVRTMSVATTGSVSSVSTVTSGGESSSHEDISEQGEDDGDLAMQRLERTDTAIANSNPVLPDPAVVKRQGTAIDTTKGVHDITEKIGNVDLNANKPEMRRGSSKVEPEIAPPSIRAGSTVRVLSLNLCIRPPLIKNNKSDHKDARLQYFCEKVLPNYDVVALQQVYAYGSSRQKKLVSMARQLGYGYYLRSPARGLLKGTIDGGLLILSRYPISKHARTTYEKGLNNDRLIAKGALYAKIQLTQEHALHLYNTHLQTSTNQLVSDINEASAQKRFRQLHHLRDFVQATVEDEFINPSNPAAPNNPAHLLLLGDMNINGLASNSSEYAAMMDILHGNGLPHQGLAAKLGWRDLLLNQFGTHPITFGDDPAKSNAGVTETTLTEKSLIGSCQSVDYSFWSVVGREGANKTTESLKTGDIQVLPLLINPNSEPTHLSDHYGVAMQIHLL